MRGDLRGGDGRRSLARSLCEHCEDGVEIVHRSGLVQRDADAFGAVAEVNVRGFSQRMDLHIVGLCQFQCVEEGVVSHLVTKLLQFVR